ncbi:MAG: DUF3592 domain-containing protein [Pyrinomonadaceae bacterium]|nr:DUF3592 domain-containing protein [Pyrinomonadaceae bacterium]
MNNYRDIITGTLDAESSSYRKSGWAWIGFGLIAQSLLFVFFKRDLFEHSLYGSFVFLSAPLAWWPILGGLVYLRRARRASHPHSPLRRALTTEPQLLKTLKGGLYRTPTKHLIDVLHHMVASIGKNEWQTVETNSCSPDACIYLTLADGKRHRLSAFKDSREITAAIQAHAPHIEVVSDSKATAGEIPEARWRFNTRVILILFGVPIFLFCSIVVFAQFMNARTRSEFARHGLRTTAVVSNLSSYRDNEEDKSSWTHYIVQAKFETSEGKSIDSRTRDLVTESDYAKLKVGDSVEVYYLPQPPHNFALVESAERHRHDSLNPIFVFIGLFGLLSLVTGIIMSLKRKRSLTSMPLMQPLS